MKIKAVVETFVVGILVAGLSYRALISPATMAAIAIRHKMPNAWFSGLVTWYAAFAVCGVSAVIAAVVCRMVYRHADGSSPKS
jgi:hypothetical protein